MLNLYKAPSSSQKLLTCLTFPCLCCYDGSETPPIFSETLNIFESFLVLSTCSACHRLTFMIFYSISLVDVSQSLTERQ